MNTDTGQNMEHCVAGFQAGAAIGAEAAAASSAGAGGCVRQEHWQRSKKGTEAMTVGGCCCHAWPWCGP